MAQRKTKASQPPDPAKRCFIITPIGDPGTPERKHADWVKEYAVKPVMEPRGYRVSRADEIPDPSMITDTIFDLITTCDVCVADLSFLNQNVFYELGVRHAFQKPVIHIAQIGTPLPFDNSGHRTTFFDVTDVHSLDDLRRALSEQLDQIESPDFHVSNPLTQARGRVQLANSADAPAQLVADMAERLARMEATIAGLTRRSHVADGIYGQGQLATMNVRDLEQALGLTSPSWRMEGNGSASANAASTAAALSAGSAARSATAATTAQLSAEPETFVSGRRRPLY
jgi:nucleoside 2-deoxyribosyltransferase